MIWSKNKTKSLKKESPMPPVNLPEDGRWLLFFLSIGTAWGNWARGVFYWVSSVRCLYNHARLEERAGEKRERENYPCKRIVLYYTQAWEVWVVRLLSDVSETWENSSESSSWTLSARAACSKCLETFVVNSRQFIEAARRKELSLEGLHRRVFN